MLDNLEQLTAKSKLKNAVLSALSSDIFSDVEIQMLHTAFQELDVDGDGSVSASPRLAFLVCCRIVCGFASACEFGTVFVPVSICFLSDLLVCNAQRAMAPGRSGGYAFMLCV